MVTPLAHYAFTAGELSPSLSGRPDLEKYDIGAATLWNFFVDYRGGATSRSGSELVGELPFPDSDNKLVEFEFNQAVGNNYIIEFGLGYIRFAQDGGYVLEGDKVITGVTNATPPVVTAVAHSYVIGDQVFIDGIVGMDRLLQRYYRVSATPSANTFEIEGPSGDVLDTTTFGTYSSGGTASRVFTVVSPYAVADLQSLVAVQRLDTVTLTHVDYDKMELRRLAADNWTLVPIVIGSTSIPPTTLQITPSAGGPVGFMYTVTTVDADGQESIGAPTVVTTNSVDFTTVAGSMLVEWDAVAGASSYNVYRSLVAPIGANITRAAQLGFIGRAFGPRFTDANIIPDFVVAPPTNNDPFANATITEVNVTAAGTGHTLLTLVNITDPNGTGFIGIPVVAGGKVLSVIVVSGGSGYTAPVVSFTVGSSATAVAEIGPAVGNNPACSAFHQQRRNFAGTTNFPDGIWGSKPGSFNNFDFTVPSTDADSFQFTLVSKELNPIRHMVSLKGGLVLMTASTIWQLKGSGDNSTITPLDAEVEPQSYNGASQLRPITTDSDIVYSQEKGSIVQALGFNFYQNSYTSQDLSILSNHFFEDHEILDWSYAKEPFKTIWAVREDGAVLALAFVKEHNVFAWTQHHTRGLWKNVAKASENKQDIPYYIVRRFINGKWRRFLERNVPRIQQNVEDHWGLDCAIARALRPLAADLVLSAATGSGITATASAGVFVSGDVGCIIRAGGGKMLVTAFTSSTVVVCDVQIDVTDILEEDPANKPLPIDAGAWTCTQPVTTVGGLNHLEGELVTILADGNVGPQKTVVDGSITLDHEASRIIVGLPYQCYIKTLPVEVIEQTLLGKRKAIVGMAVKVNETRGLKTGPTLEKLHEVKERTNEDYGEPITLQNGDQYSNLDIEWNDEGQVFIVQDNPLPAVVLGYMLRTEAGDDDN